MARRAAVAGAAAIFVAGAAALLLFMRDGAAHEPPPAMRVAPASPSAGRMALPPARAGAARADGAVTAGPLRARLVRSVLLPDRPGGRILRSLTPRTEFGSRRVLAVVAQRPGWLGVLTHHVRNSRAAWIPAAAAQLLLAPDTLHVDLSARTLVVRRHGRVARRVGVAVGRPATSTPTGRFAVTDALVDGRPASPYGCCVLALTGRQPNLPPGWTGGDRLAIHGTTNERTLGTPASSGCLRAGDADMRWLITNVPPGTLVIIRA